MYAKKQPFQRGATNATHRPFKQLQRNPLKPVKKALLRIYEASFGYGWSYQNISGPVEELFAYITDTAKVDTNMRGKLTIVTTQRTVTPTSSIQDEIEASSKYQDYSDLDAWTVLHNPENVGKVFNIVVKQTAKHFYGLTEKIIHIVNVKVKADGVAVISEWSRQEPIQVRLDEMKKFFKSYNTPLFDNMGNKISPELVTETLEKWHNI